MEDNFDLKKYLAEGRLFEEENPIWTIDSFEDSADIEQAGPSYKKAIIDIIKAKHSNISSKDLEKSIEVTNNFWYDEARDNAKGSDPEDIKVSAKEFADSAIEYYEDALIPPSGEVDDDIDDRFSNFPSKEKSFDHNLQWYLNNSPTLLRHMQPDVKADFLNYAEKSLKPSNASPKEIEDAINIFYKKQFS